LDEAAALLCFALQLAPEALQNNALLPLDDQRKQRLWTLMQRRISKKIPSAYITCETRFAGLPFYIDTRVLIPRSPMAELIEDEFKPWIASMENASVLELGTGSGCIALAIAVHNPGAQVLAVDIDPEALRVAQINLQKFALQQRVKFLLSDWFAGIEAQSFDLIISNPPYVPAASLQQLPAEYAHEPNKALASGEDGLDAVLTILAQAHEFLKANGVLIVEVGEVAERLQDTFPAIAFTWLEFERGGEGVFLLEAQQLHQHKDLLQQTWQKRFT
jgi:ribosomal protein L3 glutamine methyltransferase